MSSLTPLQQFILTLDAPQWHAIVLVAWSHVGQHYVVWQDSTIQLSITYRDITPSRGSWSYTLDANSVQSTVLVLTPGISDSDIIPAGAEDLYLRIKRNILNKLD